jgi:hypothetical protein
MPRLAAAFTVLVLATARSASAADPPAPKPPKWYDTIEMHGYVDTYFQGNFDQPQAVQNALRLFDASNGFQLAFAKLTAQMAPSPAGFRVDFGFGPTAGILSGRTPASTATTALSGLGDTTVEQAYATFKLPADVVIDGGRFVTAAGSEVIEAKDDWIYTRSLMFNFAIPFTHVGIRATAPIPGVPGLSAQAMLFNGWDAPPNPVGGKKAGHVGLTYSGPSATTAVLNVIYGNVNQAAPEARLLLDAVVGRAFGKLELNLNADYARESGLHYWGVSGMVRYAFLGGKLHLAGRGEYFSDPDGLAIGTPGAKYWEGTVNLALAVTSTVELRLEGRTDHSNTNAFDLGRHDYQNTMTLAAMAWF